MQEVLLLFLFPGQGTAGQVDQQISQTLQIVFLRLLNHEVTTERSISLISHKGTTRLRLFAVVLSSVESICQAQVNEVNPVAICSEA
jgi:hypothetical protein